MSNWINFSTVSKWDEQNYGSTDCSTKCRVCEKTWHDIKLEGRGDESIHMIELKPEDKTPCGLAYAFECDTCYLTQSLL
jgi:hypothetical protein